MPACGVQAGGDRERHRQRQRDQADGDAGDEIVPEGDAVVVAQRENRLGEPGHLPGHPWRSSRLSSRSIDWLSVWLSESRWFRNSRATRRRSATSGLRRA